MSEDFDDIDLDELRKYRQPEGNRSEHLRQSILNTLAKLDGLTEGGDEQFLNDVNCTLNTVAFAVEMAATKGHPEFLDQLHKFGHKILQFGIFGSLFGRLLGRLLSGNDDADLDDFLNQE